MFTSLPLIGSLYGQLTNLSHVISLEGLSQAGTPIFSVFLFPENTTPTANDERSLEIPLVPKKFNGFHAFLFHLWYSITLFQSTIAIMAEWSLHFYSTLLSTKFMYYAQTLCPSPYNYVEKKRKSLHMLCLDELQLHHQYLSSNKPSAPGPIRLMILC